MHLEIRSLMVTITCLVLGDRVLQYLVFSMLPYFFSFKVNSVHVYLPQLLIRSKSDVKLGYSWMNNDRVESKNQQINTNYFTNICWSIVICLSLFKYV